MKKSLKILSLFLKNKFGKVKSQEFWNDLYMLSLQGMNIGGGAGILNSGEMAALKWLQENVFTSSEKLCLFDVGANIGGYTVELLKLFQNCEIHGFEPAAETYRTLCNNVNDARCTFNNVGISDEITESTLYYEKENSGLASLYNRQLDYFGIEFSKSEKIQLDTLDHYCEEHEIAVIDFLKMDIEGNELSALKGCKKMIETGNVRVIQIEFGGCNLDSRTYFRDFWNLLHTQYHIYRIVVDGLWKILNYDERLEIFTCTNYIFVHK